MPSPLQSLIASGTKLWLDSIDPELVQQNRAWGATGATSNPIIVSDLIETGRFDEALKKLLRDGLTDHDVAWALTDQLVRGAALFRLLGDPTRVRLLYALLEAGELCVCDLAAATGTAETTVSQSLRMLRASGVVTGRRQGRLVFYRLADAHVRLLLDLAREHLGHQPAAGPAAPPMGR